MGGAPSKVRTTCTFSFFLSSDFLFGIYTVSYACTDVCIIRVCIYIHECMYIYIYINIYIQCMYMSFDLSMSHTTYDYTISLVNEHGLGRRKQRSIRICGCISKKKSPPRICTGYYYGALTPPYSSHALGLLPHRNTLQHTAAHCNTLHYAALHCTSLQCTAANCNTLQHTGPHCLARGTLQRAAARCTRWHAGPAALVACAPLQNN